MVHSDEWQIRRSRRPALRDDTPRERPHQPRALRYGDSPRLASSLRMASAERHAADVADVLTRRQLRNAPPTHDESGTATGITFDRIAQDGLFPVASTTAAEVSSQEVSMPRINLCWDILSHQEARRRNLVREKTD